MSMYTFTHMSMSRVYSLLVDAAKFNLPKEKERLIISTPRPLLVGTNYCCFSFLSYKFQIYLVRLKGETFLVKNLTLRLSQSMEFAFIIKSLGPSWD